MPGKSAFGLFLRRHLLHMRANIVHSGRKRQEKRMPGCLQPPCRTQSRSGRRGEAAGHTGRMFARDKERGKGECGSTKALFRPGAAACAGENRENAVPAKGLHRLLRYSRWPRPQPARHSLSDETVVAVRKQSKGAVLSRSFRPGRGVCRPDHRFSALRRVQNRSGGRREQ